jgi:hypothetical protein
VTGSAGPSAAPKINAPGPRALSVSGGTLAAFISTREELLWRASDVVAGIRAGWLKLRIERVLPLSQAAEAHGLLEGRQSSGKLVLVPQRCQRSKAPRFPTAKRSRSRNLPYAPAPPGAPVPPILPPQDGFLFLDKAKFPASFAADVEPEKAAFMADSQVPWGLEAISGAISEPAWRTKPSWYLLTTEDRMIPPDAQRAMSRRAGATVVEVRGSKPSTYRGQRRSQILLNRLQRTRRAPLLRKFASHAPNAGYLRCSWLHYFVDFFVQLAGDLQRGGISIGG